MLMSMLMVMLMSQCEPALKALSLRPRAFIIFLVFGNPDETLALVYEILHISSAFSPVVLDCTVQSVITSN